MNWDAFLAPYVQVVEELKVKFRGMRKQYEYEEKHSPIEFVTGRVKTIHSIIEKAETKRIDFDHIEREIQDIAGIRIVCQFVDDIYNIVDLIKSRKDLTIVEEKDYIKENKESG